VTSNRGAASGEELYVERLSYHRRRRRSQCVWLFVRCCRVCVCLRVYVAVIVCMMDASNAVAPRTHIRAVTAKHRQLAGALSMCVCYVACVRAHEHTLTSSRSRDRDARRRAARDPRGGERLASHCASCRVCCHQAGQERHAARASRWSCCVVGACFGSRSCVRIT
jgi:hypothetical protein